MHRSVVALAVVAVLLGACTTGPSDPAPDASPSTAVPSVPSSVTPSEDPVAGRVAVVVDPRPAIEAASTVAGVERLARGVDGLDEMRVVAVDDASFVRDLTAYFATEGAALVCAVGGAGRAAVVAAATDAPGTRFCVVPSPGEDLPSNVLPVAVRVEELGYAAGVALANDVATGPVGLVTAPTAIEPGRFEAGLAAGIAAVGLPDAEVVSVPPVRAEEDVEGAVASLVEAGVTGVVTLAGDLDAAVLAALDDVAVVAPEPTEAPTDATTDDASEGTPAPTVEPTEAPPPPTIAVVGGPGLRPDDDAEGDEAVLDDQVLLVLEQHLEQGVAVALRRQASTWDVAAASVGVAEEALAVEVGEGPRARAVTTQVEQALATIRDVGVSLPEPAG